MTERSGGRPPRPASGAQVPLSTDDIPFSAQATASTRGSGIQEECA
jgi:hypothetical protein